MDHLLGGSPLAQLSAHVGRIRIATRMLKARRSFAAGLLPSVVVAAFAVIPSPARAFGENGGTEVSTGMAPANGELLTHTDPIPANATQGSFGVQPLPGTDPHAFDEVTGVIVEQWPWLGKLSKRAQATLACVVLSYVGIAYKPPELGPATITDLENQAQVLSICLQMALAIPPPAAAGDAAHSATAACGRLDAAIRVKLARSRSGTSGRVAGKTRKTSRPGLTVSCRRSRNGLVLAIRPRARGQTLRQAAGPMLAIAYRNPTSKPVGLRTTFHVN